MSYKNLVRRVIDKLAPELDDLTDSLYSDVDHNEPEAALFIALLEVDNPHDLLGEELVEEILKVTRPSDLEGKEIINFLTP